MRTATENPASNPKMGRLKQTAKCKFCGENNLGWYQSRRGKWLLGQALHMKVSYG